MIPFSRSNPLHKLTASAAHPLDLAADSGSQPSSSGFSNACFRTTSDGHISLKPDWPAFLEKIQMLGKVAMQTRHAAARMIVKQPMPKSPWQKNKHWVSDPEGWLHFNIAEWGQASAQLTPCDCCGSFGRINVRNKLGKEFLQLCAVTESELATWGAFLSVTAPRNTVLPETVSLAHPTSQSPETCPEAWTSRLPSVPADAVLVSHNVDTLLNLVEVLQGENLPVKWTLRAEEFCHTRIFAPEQIDVPGNRILSARGAQAETVQLGLPLVQGLAIDPHAADAPLHIVGPDNSRLLTLASSDESDAAHLWRTILENFFPNPCGN